MYKFGVKGKSVVPIVATLLLLVLSCSSTEIPFQTYNITLSKPKITLCLSKGDTFKGTAQFGLARSFVLYLYDYRYQLIPSEANNYGVVAKM